jgi:xanthine dehydrogenase YagT iron-sulfur-binding subunit
MDNDGVSRRTLLSATVMCAPALPALVGGLAVAPVHAGDTSQSGPLSYVELVVNGSSHRLAIDPRTTLLDALREHLGLTGSKKGCDHGQCGACTVLVGGVRVLACLSLAMSVRQDVTTIEGLSSPDGHLHPMQQAFIDQDAFQCGYCTPGQIMSAVGCVNEGQASTEDQIREYMSGNLCRCAASPHIVEAVKQAKAQMESA